MKKVLAGLFIVQFIFAGNLFIFPTVQASNSQTWNSRDNFEEGINQNTSTSQFDGDVSLEFAGTPYTETTKDDFGKGGSGSFDAINVDNDGGEIILNQGYGYKTDSIPSIIGNWVEYSWLDSSTGLLYMSADGGVVVSDTKNTLIQEDDEVLITYNENSTPALLTDNIQSKGYGKSFIDPSTGFLYIIKTWSDSATSNGVQVVDTKGTKSPSDDTFVTSYTKSGSVARFFSDEDVVDCEMDYDKGFLYCIGNDANGGITMIDTKKTDDPSDDTSLKYTTTGIYNTTSGVNTLISATPKLPSQTYSYQNELKLDKDKGLIYVSTDKGVYVINIQGTVSVTDDTSYTYMTTGIFDTTNSSAGVQLSSVAYPEYVNHLNIVDNIIYVSAYNGFSVINTQGTVDSADDVLVNTYNTTSNPGFETNGVYHSFLDGNLIYVSTSKGIYVIDTNETIDPSDDDLFARYNTGTVPALEDNYANSSFLNSDHNLLYVNTDYGGLSVINLDEKYDANGSRRSQSLSLSSIPHKVVSWEANQSEGQATNLQYRLGGSDVVWRNDFDDNDASEYMGDFGGWGHPFQTAVESEGTLKLSNPNPYLNSNENSGADGWIDTGEAEGYFPIETKVTARVRINSQTREIRGWYEYIFNEDWWDSYGESMPNNEWRTISFIARTKAFSKIGFEIGWRTGTWNNANDSFEIDYLEIEIPEYANNWGEWSTSCSNNYGCNIDPADLLDKSYIQYKANLATQDFETTPSINSITFSDGYKTQGTYTSQNISYPDTAEIYSFSADTTIPEGTTIGFQYSFDQGVTWVDLPLINNSFSFPSYTKTKDFKWRATLSTNSIFQSPIIHSVTILTDQFNLESFSNESDSIEIAKNSTFKAPLTFTGNNYTQKDKPALWGNNPQAKNGTVEIYEKKSKGHKKKIDSVSISSGGEWKYKFKREKDGKNVYYLKTLDSVGNETSTSKPLKIIRDTKDPLFTVFPQGKTYRKGGKLIFTAQDETTKIDHYKVMMSPSQKDWRKQKQDFYVIPKTIPTGNYIFKVRVYDKAGNKLEKEVAIKVVD